MQLFGRAAIPMVWDFAEANVLADRAICWKTAVELAADALETLGRFERPSAEARQLDAAAALAPSRSGSILVSTDPPYYDNIGYADLSDFFYVWLRPTVGQIYPDLFSTVLVPKAQELVAATERFDGDKDKAKGHFEDGFRKAFGLLRERLDPRFPLTVYYAFKQDDENGDDGDDGTPAEVNLTTGWETLLESLVGTGFQVTATWPVRASQAWRMRAMGSNALASYIVLACRSRSEAAPLAWTSRKPRSDPGWPSFRDTPRWLSRTDRVCRCGQRSASSTRFSPRCSTSKRASSMPTRVGHSRGSSSSE
jgi:putative DNA methylase